VSCIRLGVAATKLQHNTTLTEMGRGDAWTDVEYLALGLSYEYIQQLGKKCGEDIDAHLRQAFPAQLQSLTSAGGKDSKPGDANAVKHKEMVSLLTNTYHIEFPLLTADKAKRIISARSGTGSLKRVVTSLATTMRKHSTIWNQ
jgi:hypothetical protein